MDGEEQTKRRASGRETTVDTGTVASSYQRSAMIKGEDEGVGLSFVFGTVAIEEIIHEDSALTMEGVATDTFDLVFSLGMNI